MQGKPVDRGPDGRPGFQGLIGSPGPPVSINIMMITRSCDAVARELLVEGVLRVVRMYQVNLVQLYQLKKPEMMVIM